jgi:tRNA pseudouridine38-40 synthase
MRHLSEGGDLRNLLLTITYDGKGFHGWQIQPNAYTVQEALQTALAQVIGEDFELKGCSRTDSGVHANMYCVSVKTVHPIPPERLRAALNRWLPLTVAVKDCREAETDFHARYSCKSKEYIYKIWNSEVRSPFLEGYALHYRYPLNEQKLHQAAQAYVGSHDFTSFCTLDNREPGDLTRTVKAFSVTREGDMVVMKVEADGFLYNMVRIMVGTLLYMAQGKLGYDAIPQILEKRDRSFAGPTAPACGLYLNQVHY